MSQEAGQADDGVWFGSLGPASGFDTHIELLSLAPLQRFQLAYDGQLRTIYQLFFRNLLLTLATAGIYYFWGKVRLRQYLWSRLSLDGYRFEFRGRGGEMFKGFLMILCGLAVWGIATTIVEFWLPFDLLWGRAVVAAATFAVIFFLAFVAQFSAQRYRLTRTRWRGIGGGMRGSALVYAIKAMLLMALVPLSLFQARPFVSLRLLEHRLNRTSIGDRAVSFTGCRAGQIYGRYLLGCFGVVLCTIVVWFGLTFAFYRMLEAAPEVLFGIGAQTVIGAASYLLFSAASSWLMAGFWSRYWNHAGHYIRWGEVGVEIQSTRRMFVRHRVVHFFAILFSFGLAYPWALHRVTRFFAESVALTGNLAPAQLGQTDLTGAAIGEGLLNAFDPGFI